MDRLGWKGSGRGVLLERGEGDRAGFRTERWRIRGVTTRGGRIALGPHADQIKKRVRTQLGIDDALGPACRDVGFLLDNGGIGRDCSGACVEIATWIEAVHPCGGGNGIEADPLLKAVAKRRGPD